MTVEKQEIKLVREFDKENRHGYIKDLQSAVAQAYDLFIDCNSYTDFQGIKYIIHQVTSDGWFFLCNDPGTQLDNDDEKSFYISLKKDIRDKLSTIECEMRSRGWYWH